MRLWTCSGRATLKLRPLAGDNNVKHLGHCASTPHRAFDIWTLDPEILGGLLPVTAHSPLQTHSTVFCPPKPQLLLGFHAHCSDSREDDRRKYRLVLISGTREFGISGMLQPWLARHFWQIISSWCHGTREISVGAADPSLEFTSFVSIHSPTAD